MKPLGDGEKKLTAETRRRGETQKPTTEAQRHGESHRNSVLSDHPITRSLYLCHPERVGANATASRKTPARLVLRNAVSGSSHDTLKSLFRWFESALQTIRAALLEIFDESAYDRFLLRTHASRSTASYRAFTRERDAAMAKKPRCC